MIFTTEQMIGFPAMVGFPEAKMANCDSTWQQQQQQQTTTKKGGGGERKEKNNLSSIIRLSNILFIL